MGEKSGSVIKIAICDDDMLMTGLLCGMARKWAGERDRHIELSVYHSAESFRFSFSEGPYFDIILLDIQMGGEDGMSLAREIRKQGGGAEIIFITAYTDYVFEGYSVYALNYIVKPVREEQLFETLDRALTRDVSGGIRKKPLFFLSAGEKIRVFQEDILYIEAAAHTADIFTADVKYNVARGLSSIEKELDAALFCRPHRSYIVNTARIERITKTDVMLDSGVMVPLSRNNHKSVNDAFIRVHIRGGGGRDA